MNYQLSRQRKYSANMSWKHGQRRSSSRTHPLKAQDPQSRAAWEFHWWVVGVFIKHIEKPGGWWNIFIHCHEAVEWLSVPLWYTWVVGWWAPWWKTKSIKTPWSIYTFYPLLVHSARAKPGIFEEFSTLHANSARPSATSWSLCLGHVALCSGQGISNATMAIPQGFLFPSPLLGPISDPVVISQCSG